MFIQQHMLRSLTIAKPGFLQCPPLASAKKLENLGFKYYTWMACYTHAPTPSRLFYSFILGHLFGVALRYFAVHPKQKILHRDLHISIGTHVRFLRLDIKRDSLSSPGLKRLRHLIKYS